MGFFRRLAEFGRDMGEIARDVGTLAKESRQEFTEIMTDGFKEMVIKDNNDYKTSFEKKDEAQSIISSAKSRLNSKVREMNTYASETELYIHEFYAYKQEIAEGIMEVAEITMESFTNYDMKSKIQPLITNFETIGTVDYSVAASASLSGMLVNFNRFTSQANRVQEADDYLEDAKDYRSKVNHEIARLDTVKAKMQYIQEVMDDEINLLEKLSPRLVAVVEELDDYMGKKHITNEDVMRAEGIFKIAEMIHRLMTTTFINNDLTVSQKYLNDLSQLKNLITD